MDETVYMVRATSREACQTALDRLCAALDARPTLLPSDIVGPGWVARAIAAPAPREPGMR
ncbi:MULTISPECIES: hypothetical protein [unclassified Streptomyces]|uniref:hypothetical protein n=1 Tax=unclassified Streptomyces TaxID=2593676 RepID=UPI000DD7604D|nr:MULTISPECIES: hypothetical protein [unclassified Streptomyces]QZZ26540.1 hypothetical protein A7X85_09980 [Streptomyces sp. ST1015]